jgi:tripartite-type tricarboxylate transporter receptor subunit TctC
MNMSLVFCRRALHAFGRTAVAALALQALTLSGAAAQDFPTRRITLIVPYAPGGQGDFIGRLVTQRLSERFGQAIVIENRPSVTGNVGVIAGSRAAPDGYTLTLISNQNLVSNLVEQGSFNLVRDMIPVSKLAEYYLLLLVQPSLPVRNVEELLALMKSKPGGVSLGSGGIGSSGHVAMGLIKQKTGAEALHVPYKGEGPAITAMLGAEVNMAFITVSGALAQVKAGKLKPLAVTSPKRLSAFPDLPSIAEIVPGGEVVSWFGIAAPLGTPRNRVDLISKEIAAVLQMPEVRQTLIDRSFEVVGSTSDQFRQNMQNDAEVLGRLIKELGIKPD